VPDKRDLRPVIPDIVFNQTLNLLRRKELLTTDTELKAMAAEARMGLSRMPQKG